MVAFIVYDVIFLVAFSLFVIMFLHTRKKNLERQGILYLYKTQLGVKFIDKFAKKFGWILSPLRYIVLISGFTLMAGIVWMIIWTTYLYLKFPFLSQAIKAPPVFPLIPYFPKLFGLESFFPPLYFTYFIVALAIVAIVHEFSHGIYMKFFKYKIKSTGFAFLGPVLGAFVEQDEKDFNKSKKLPQMIVLAAGTFANVLMTILFFGVMALFFTSLFVPAGVKYNSYALSQIDMASVEVIGESGIEGYIEIEAIEQDSIGNGYLQLAPDEIEELKSKFLIREMDLDSAIEGKYESLVAIIDSPAVRAKMRGAITEIDGVKIDSYEKFSNVLGTHSPGDTIEIKTAILEAGRGTVEEVNTYDIELANRDGRAFLGVGFVPAGRGGIIGWLIDNTYGKMKDPIIHYESEIGDFGWFIFYLLWWIVVINLLVALFNMLPLGILDGGRFFMLAVWGITGNLRFSKKAYSFITWFLLLLFLLLMVKWVFRFF
jgi:membrane-associated protease RseP (regulator of RpoE activity)